jgi:NifU-like protein involved in Fe-S cluster formation
MQIDEALEIKPKQIMERLGGLPSRKFHCSVLGDKALKGAIYDYFEKSGQEERIK